MAYFFQDSSFLLLVLIVIGLIGVLFGWLLRASLSERPIIEAYERLEQDRNSLARLYAQVRDQHELRSAEVKKLNLEILQIKDELANFSIEKAVRETSTENFTLRLEKAEADAAHYAEKVQFLETQLDQLRTRNSQLLLELDRLREELKTWMTLNRDFAALQKQVQELESLNAAFEKERRGLQLQLDTARIEIENLQIDFLRSTTATGHPLGTVAADNEGRMATPTHLAGSAPDADDLKLINGITPFAEQQLRAMGFHRFEQISNWDDTAVQAIAAALNISPEKILSENWISQAKMLEKLRNKRV